MTHDLRGRAVIVTGSSRGIGAGIVKRLLASGAHVLGASRSGAPDLTEVAGSTGVAGATGDEGLSGSGSPSRPGELVQIQCDLLSSDAPKVVLDAALDAFGRVDGLVNNAGLLLEGACWEQSDAELDAMLAINLTAPFRLSQRIASHWLEHGTGKRSGHFAGTDSKPDRQARGVIVNVCSIESQVGWADPPQAAYAASKGGLLGLTRAMALELAPRGIRVVAVGPGAIATPMTPNGPAVTDAIPLERRLGMPEEVGDVVAFLLSDAASYITGEIVYADGGYLAA